MATKIEDRELLKHLGDILDRIREHGEYFLIERDGEPIASLQPITPPKGITLQELIDRVGDIYMPGDGFADAVEEAQANQGKAEFPEWPS